NDSASLLCFIFLPKKYIPIWNLFLYKTHTITVKLTIASAIYHVLNSNEDEACSVAKASCSSSATTSSSSSSESSESSESSVQLPSSCSSYTSGAGISIDCSSSSKSVDI